jgi:archaetidylinositol phosphate synthase
MLDTNARHHIQPVLDAIAKGCQRIGISANTLTVIGMLVGVAAAGLIVAEFFVAGFVVLWLSGLIDAADGTLARLSGPSPLGAILDITFDRVVEIAMIVALAIRFPDARLELLILAGTIAIAMSLFLSIAAAVANTSIKSFHYAPGLGERTEAFICFSLMILDHTRLVLWTWVFIGVIVFTMLQRVYHVRRECWQEPRADEAKNAA